jgi:hypothetical protein
MRYTFLGRGTDERINSFLNYDSILSYFESIKNSSEYFLKAPPRFNNKKEGCDVSSFYLRGRGVEPPFCCFATADGINVK